MGTILDAIAAYAGERVAADKAQLPPEALRQLCARSGAADGQAFLDALQKPGMSFICEVKKASPSRGVISADFPYLEIAEAYEAAGADCLSCLTEPKWFLGSDQIFRDIRRTVSTPMLRKDFTVDEYQLYQAKLLGANAVLLICAILDTRTIARYLEICDGLGLAALVEAHDEGEIASAVSAGAKIIGVNNRNLKDFTVDISNSLRLRELIPKDVLFVSESGMKTRADIARLEENGTDAVLVGETFMRAKDKAEMLRQLRGKEN